jgi:hypothetical protein
LNTAADPTGGVVVVVVVDVVVDVVDVVVVVGTRLGVLLPHAPVTRTKTTARIRRRMP